MSASIRTDFEGLKQMASEFHKALPTLNEDELENSWKCFGLAYMGCEFPDDLRGRTNRDASAPALLRIVSRDYLQRKLELDARPDDASPINFNIDHPLVDDTEVIKASKDAVIRNNWGEK